MLSDDLGLCPFCGMFSVIPEDTPDTRMCFCPHCKNEAAALLYRMLKERFEQREKDRQ